MRNNQHVTHPVRTLRQVVYSVSQRNAGRWLDRLHQVAER